MDSFEIVWRQSARKELLKLPQPVIARIIKLVGELAENPYRPQAKKLTSAESTYRIRSGNYRVVYNIVKGHLIIEIIRVGHRKDIYKKKP